MGERQILRDLEERDAFNLNYVQETTRPIVRMGTNTEPPFSKLKVWKQYQREPSSYDVRVDRNGVIIEGGVSVFIWDGKVYNGELWQLEPETPVPKELVFVSTPNSKEVKIKPVFNVTPHQKFRKMLGCLRWVKVGTDEPETAASS